MPQQAWAVNTLGGFAAVPYLTERVRHRSQPEFKLRQFIDAQEAVGMGRGDTFNFDKISNVATQGGTLVETSTIPETNFTIAQGTASITEYGELVANLRGSCVKILKLFMALVPTVGEMYNGQPACVRC